MNAPFPSKAWVVAVLSPTVYLLVLLLAASFEFVRRAPWVVGVSLFYVIPAVAVLLCWSVVAVARSSMTIAGKAGWMLLGLFAILLQFSIVLAFIASVTGSVPQHATEYVPPLPPR